jgi:hypothetical protein
MNEKSRPFDRATLELAFERLGRMAVDAGRIVEISVYGGSALVLTLDARPATRDVDAIFDKDRDFVRRAAKSIAEELGWSEDWINDGVKGFVSRADANSKSLFATFPTGGPEGLRVFLASPDYLFAMKCLAMRIGGVEDRGDVDDIVRLGQALGIQTADQAIAAVARYYPAERLPPKTRFGLEEIFGSRLP